MAESFPLSVLPRGVSAHLGAIGAAADYLLLAGSWIVLKGLRSSRANERTRGREPVEDEQRGLTLFESRVFDLSPGWRTSVGFYAYREFAAPPPAGKHSDFGAIQRFSRVLKPGCRDPRRAISRRAASACFVSIHDSPPAETNCRRSAAACSIALSA